MEIKVGQWVRTNDNRIFEIYFYNERANIICAQAGGYRIDEIVAVADTPQELVQVGDLITVLSIDNRKRRFEVIGFGLDDIIYTNGNMKYCNLKTSQIIEIFTPNVNGNYIKQWEVENGKIGR